MEILIIICFATLIWVVIGLILMHPMKVIQIVVPLIVIAASAFLFVVGWEWARRGNDLQMDYYGWDIKMIGHAISDLGNVIECIGVLGALVGLALFGALWYLGAYKRQINHLEEEVDHLRQSLMAMRRSEKES